METKDGLERGEEGRQGVGGPGGREAGRERCAEIDKWRGEAIVNAISIP